MAIIGPSGSGKSTLLRRINLLEILSDGEIKMDELKIHAHYITKEILLKVRRNSGMVFQNYNLFSKKMLLKILQKH